MSHSEKITLNPAHKEALDIIRDDYYQGESTSQIFMEFIEDYLAREGGRLGSILRGVYIPKGGLRT